MDPFALVALEEIIELGSPESSSARSSKTGSAIPFEHSVALPVIPGIGSSHYGSFWKKGFRAVMVTDTAFYRNPNDHNLEGTIETLRFNKMSQIARGLVRVLEYLTKAKD